MNAINRIFSFLTFLIMASPILLCHASEGIVVEKSELNYISAAKLGDYARVEVLLKGGQNVDDRQGGQYTALFYASAKGYTNIARLLLSNGADVNAAGRGGWTPIMVASLHGHSQLVTVLAEAGADLERRNSDQLTPLLIAAHHNNLNAVLALLKASADFNVETIANSTASMSVLAFAAARNNAEMVDALIKAGVSVDESKRTGRPVLFFAAENDATDIMTLLISNDAAVNALDKDKNTALHYVVGRAKPATVQFLLDKGINRKAKNIAGQTALDIAAYSGNTDVLALLYDKANDKERQQAFIRSVESGVLENVQALLNRGANNNQKNHLQQTVLMIAGANRHHKIVDLLLKNGADVNAVDARGRSALINAVSVSPMSVKSITYLLDSGANPLERDKNGETALSIIRKSLRQEKLLKAQRQNASEVLTLMTAKTQG